MLKLNMIKPLTGMKDYFGKEAKTLRYLDDLFYQTALKYNCEEIKTPILENMDLFIRSLGESSDVVSKEMFSFAEKNGSTIFTMRPEGTAGISRALFSNGLTQNLPIRYYYSGPMFRYETPQKGRYRQFNQLGVEFLGYNNYLADVECIALAYELLTKLKLNQKVQVEINSIGDEESRKNYKSALVFYLNQYYDKLSPESQDRLKTNPLRILDSKKAQDQDVVKNAPKLKDYLRESSKNWYNSVKKGLTALNIPFVENDNLVRGLDYYSETVFEITTNLLGSQNAILAGGRYNNLSSLIGGMPIPSVGFAAGAERLLLLISEQIVEKNIEVSIITVNNNDDVIQKGLQLAQKLRQQGLIVDIPQNESLNKKMKKANKNQSRYCVIIGEDEILKDQYSLKNMGTGDQSQMTESQLITFLT